MDKEITEQTVNGGGEDLKAMQEKAGGRGICIGQSNQLH